jgi:hypothetical protein
MPSPLGTFNFGANFTVTKPTVKGNTSFNVAKVSVQASDMVWVPTDSRLYLSVTSGNNTNPNTITALDPKSGQFGASATTSGEPSKLAVSPDGTYLYTGVNSIFSVRRFSLPSLQFESDIPLALGGYTNYYAASLAVSPTNPHALAVSRVAANTNYPTYNTVAIYDDKTPRPQSTPRPGYYSSIISLLWNPNGQVLYGLDSTATTAIYMMSANANGATLQSQPGVTSDLGGELHFDLTTGNLYSNSGKVLNASTGAILGSFPINALEGGFGTGNSTLIVPDGNLNIAYLLGRTVDNSVAGTYVIEAFDLTHFHLLGTISIPNVSGTPSKFVRWGENGLAFLTTGGSTPGTNGVYLVSGGFVTSPAP